MCEICFERCSDGGACSTVQVGRACHGQHVVLFRLFPDSPKVSDGPNMSGFTTEANGDLLIEICWHCFLDQRRKEKCEVHKEVAKRADLNSADWRDLPRYLQYADLVQSTPFYGGPPVINQSQIPLLTLHVDDSVASYPLLSPSSDPVIPQQPLRLSQDLSEHSPFKDLNQSILPHGIGTPPPSASVKSKTMLISRLEDDDSFEEQLGRIMEHYKSRKRKFDERDNIDTELGVVEDELKAAQDELERVRKSRNEWQAYAGKQRDAKHQVEKEKEAIAEKNTGLKEEVEGSRTETRALQERSFDLEKEIQRLRADSVGYTTENQRLTEENKAVKAERDELQQRIADVGKRLGFA